jgi:two-component system OmpR family sensor kinase
MSSSPPTDVVVENHVARWRDPAGWSLRGRLIAIMIALLAVLGIFVGASTEIFLHKALYDQADSKLQETAGRAQHFGGGGFGRDDGDRPPPGATADWIVYHFNSDQPDGLVVYPPQSAAESSLDAYFKPLSPATIAKLSRLSPYGRGGPGVTAWAATAPSRRWGRTAPR